MGTGIQLAVLAGDPSKEGMYVIRLKAPARYKVPRTCWRGAGDGGDCEPDCGAAPVLCGGTGRRHGDLDAADADAHERANFEQLETDGAAGGLREVGIVEIRFSISPRAQ